MSETPQGHGRRAAGRSQSRTPAASGSSVSRTPSSSRTKRPADVQHTASAKRASEPSSAKSKASAGAGRRSAAAAAAAPRPKKNLVNYPRAGARGIMRWFPSLRLLSMLFSLAVLAVVGFCVWLYASTNIPDASQVALAQTSRVYYADGKTVMGEFSDVNRTILPSNEVPQTVKDAVVASEDSTFYENRGISPKGILRALVNNLRGGARQGGSTITQQYVENYYTGKTTSYKGKVKEMIMAIKADQVLSKDEIIARYLNTIYFGRGTYGIEAASQAYFGKPAKDLDKSEAALLVAVIPAPSIYDPAKNPQYAQQRWARVIEREVNDTKTLTKAEADKLTFPQTIEPKKKNTYQGTKGYLLNSVKKELEAQGLTADQIDKGGYTIISTIDQSIQKNAEDAVAAMPSDRPANNRLGIITIDPSNGAIRAMYGGPDFLTQGQNDATQSQLQGGSTFKAFALAAALEDGYSLDSEWDASPTLEIGNWKVENYDHEDGGMADLREATKHSYNTPFAALNVEMGPKKTLDMAVKMGLPANTPGLAAEGANVLGSASPTVKNMAESYATLASGGIHRNAHFIQTVKNPDGSTKYEAKDTSNRVMKESTAINATSALLGPPSSGGTASSVGEAFDPRQIAGKTGTSSDNRSAWFIGYTPQLVTAVGMFQVSENGKSEEQLTPFGDYQAITGGSSPAQVWIDMMTPTLKGMEMKTFPKEVDSGSKSGNEGVSRSNSSNSNNSDSSSSRSKSKATQAPAQQEQHQQQAPAQTSAPAQTAVNDSATQGATVTQAPAADQQSGQGTGSQPNSNSNSNSNGQQNSNNNSGNNQAPGVTVTTVPSQGAGTNP